MYHTHIHKHLIEILEVYSEPKKHARCFFFENKPLTAASIKTSMVLALGTEI